MSTVTSILILAILTLLTIFLYQRTIAKGL